FVFVAYDDPALFTKAGMDRVAELAAALGPDRIDGVLRVESLDAMPLLWAVDDILLTVVQAPPLLRNFALGTAKKAVRGLDLKNNTMTVGGAVRAAPNDEALRSLKDRATHHPLFNGTVVDGTGNTTAVVVRLKKTGDHDVTRTITAIREIADKFGRAYRL